MPHPPEYALEIRKRRRLGALNRGACFNAMLNGWDNQRQTFQVLKQDRFIASCASWNDFWQRAKKLPTNGEKGAVFERLTQLYLQTTPDIKPNFGMFGHSVRYRPPSEDD